ncbi:hypothetical protein R3P38DRAFT_2847848 [Favolaschia claudopus]|uniref:BTB domain-containing protein n=1 Tax=Favolaschia claudopus TaxID=2862362 RepID=A0AAW0DWQ2_9AGAR
MSCATLILNSMDIVASDSENSNDEMPLVKRRRLSGSCNATSRRTMVKKLWFPDGDIVLAIEKRLLKVHRRRLCCSTVFSDMLHIPQPPETDQIDGCPSVELVGDTLADWEVSLGWIYDHNYFQQNIVTFDLLSGALRIATKYDIGGLRQWAVNELLSRWPEDVANLSLNALPHAAEAINLAQECNVPEILPSCFYALSVQKFRSSADGGRSHIILSPNDLRRLIAGREALQDALVRIIVDPLTEAGCYNNAFCGQCAPRRLEYWRTRLAPDPKSVWSTWLVRELEQMLRDDQFVNSLCSDCVHAHLSTIRWRLGRLRCSISSFFLL